MDKEIYDDLRPYFDNEIPAALERIVNDPTFESVVKYSFPDTNIEDIRRDVLASKTADEFQLALGLPLLQQIIDSTIHSFTFDGTQSIAPQQGYLYVSNHRDIVLDAALLQYAIHQDGLQTTEITFGNNLISSQFIEDFGRSNKMFKIVRDGSTRDLLQNSQILSEHLHNVVADNRSIWISQRDGRTKDGNDRTDQGLVKMFAMYGSNTKEALKSLNITPVAMSYQYEPCDFLKANEIYISRRETYVKTQGEDLKSILKGIQQYKGDVDIHICKPIAPEEIDALSGDNNNEILRGMAQLIDNRIALDYKLFDTNYIAHDILNDSTAFADKYTSQAKSDFVAYVETGIALLNGEKKELFDIVLNIYANPVKSFLSAATL